MRRFVGFSNQGPDELVSAAKKDVVKGTGKLNDFYAHLVKRGVATSTALHYNSSDRSWFGTTYCGSISSTTNLRQLYEGARRKASSIRGRSIKRMIGRGRSLRTLDIGWDRGLHAPKR